MEKKRKDALVFEGKDVFPITDLEAVDRYQRLRRGTSHLTLISKGEQSALCLMLASRFMPDEIHIFPLLGCGIDLFLREVSRRVSFLYFVCAPIKIYVTNTITEYEKTKLKRLLRSISSFQKEIVYVDSEFEAFCTLTNLYKTTKTLA